MVTHFVSIPAYAGLYRRRPLSARAHDEYPRIRGVVSRVDDLLAIIYTVSPHTRGCIYGGPHAIGTAPSIPAYAGLYRSVLVWRQYPRIRGVVSNRSCGGTAIPPVSPHTRGCINQLAVRITFHDSIPAYAGLYRQDVSIFGGM